MANIVLINRNPHIQTLTYNMANMANIVLIKYKP